jgi:hypothetical protein
VYFYVKSSKVVRIGEKILNKKLTVLWNYRVASSMTKRLEAVRVVRGFRTKY